MSILAGTGPTLLTQTWYVDGDPSDPGTVTIGIVDGDDTIVVAAGTATNNTGVGVSTYSLAIQAVPKQLTITWTAGSQTQIDTLEVVGGWLYTEPDLRVFYGSDLDAATYSDAQLAEARERITTEFEQICSVSFTRRWRRENLSGDGTYLLRVERPYISSVVTATVGGTDVSSTVSADPFLPYLHRTSGTWNRATTTDPFNVDVSYVHGHATVPPDVKRAAMILARQQLAKDVTGQGIPETASSWNDSTGQYVSFAANDQTERWYGIPAVDTALRRYNLNVAV